MKKLFLASYFSNTAPLFAEFAAQIGMGKKVLFIPTAAVPEKVNFYIAADKKALEKLGFTVQELEILTASKEEIAQKIAETDAIFVAGGNTFFLLQALKESGADALIADHIAQGKPYIGSSAGSIVLAKNIEYAALMDSTAAAPRLDGDFSALGIVDFCVVPHVNNFPFKKAAQKVLQAYGDKMDLCPIGNHQAVAVQGDEIELRSKVN